MKKAQINIFVLVFAIAIFAALVIFLLSLSRTVTISRYENLYATNLLVSLMRTDTGHYTDMNCKQVSDVIKCAYLTPTWQCGDDGPCQEFANVSVDSLLRRFHYAKKGFRYLLTVDSIGAIVEGPTGERLHLVYGDESLARAKIKKLPATYYIEMPSSSGSYQLKVQLIIAD